MSASREKKQRQDVVSQGPTQAELREKKAAADRRRNSIIYWAVGVVAAVAIVALLVWDSGVFQRNAGAASVGSTTLSVAEMQCCYGLVRQSDLYNQYYYSAMGYAYLSDPYRTYDRASALGDQQVYNTETGQTYRQHWEEEALTYAQQLVAVTAAAKAEGFALSEDGQKTVDEAMADLDANATDSGYPNTASFVAANYGRYVTVGIYKDIMYQQQLASEYQTHCQSAKTYTQADYDAYAVEHPQDVNSYDYRYVFISGSAIITDADGKTVEPTDAEKAAAMAEAKAKADALVAGVQAAQVAEKEEEPADDADKAPADGDAAPADGDAAPADGDAAPADGDAAPADGDAAPADGDAAPADGDAAPADGEGDKSEDKPAAEPEEEPLSPEEALLKAKEDAFNKLVVDAVGATSAYANPSSNLQQAVLGYDLSPSYYNSVFYQWLTDPARVPGDITAVEGTETNPGYHVVLFLDRYLDNENTVNVRHILIRPEELKDDPDTPDVDESKGPADDPETPDIDESKVPTEQQLADAKAKAEAILAEFEAGEKTEEAFAKLANENSSDTGSNTAGGLYTYVQKGDMVPNFDAWIFDPARKVGDTGIVSNVEPGSRYYGYHVMYFSKLNDPRWPTVADSALKAEANNSWLDGLLAPYPAKALDGMSMIH